MKMRIVLAGGSGFIGKSLTPLLLARNYEVVVLTRSASTQRADVRYAQWDGKTIGEWAQCIDGAAAVVNLTGRSVNCRHTAESRREIIESRVNSVRVLGEAMTKCAHPPKVFVQAAGIGIYGDGGDRWCDENAPHGNDFIAEVCKRWEAAFDALEVPGTRKVLLRLGVVLGPNGGFLKVLSRLTRFFLGGQVGDGQQFISWIHIADLNCAIRWTIEREDVAGVFNATSPNPVRNADFMRELRGVLRRPWTPPVPKWAARIGSWLMKTEASLAFVSQRAIPKHLLESGFKFEFPEPRPALANIFPSP